MRLHIFDAGAGKQPVMRHQIANYLKVGDDYELMGAGFTKLDENPGAKSDSEVYINDRTASASVTSYETTFPFDTKLIPSEKAGYALYKVGRNHLVGDDAQFEYVIADLFNPIGAESETSAVYTARQFTAVANISSFSGGGGEKFQASGELQAVGDPVLGKFDTVTKTFTAGTFAGKYDEEAAG